MRKLVILALVVFVCLNIKATSGQNKKLSCYACRSYNASGCTPNSAAEPSECPSEYPYCIAFVGVSAQTKKTVYFRNCFRGDCDAERKSEPNVELKQCKACKTSLCNDDAFE